MSVVHLRQQINISVESRKDINWWYYVIESWNGIELVQDRHMEATELEFFSDASFLGIGGYFAGHWFSIPLPVNTYANITYLNMMTVKACVVT